MLTIVLSGPRPALSQAKNALAGAGCELGKERLDATFGFEDDESVGFLRCKSPDLDRALGAVKRFGFRLRAHYSEANHLATSESPASALEERLRRLEAVIGGQR